ncbi:hypothetical protein [Streptomyces cahuitamycinicus]|uniref:hypothetical protein n=1 Tax=Streptomyces cahuitamycinicus TaxID=2070367 RepID=UPI003F6E361C
MSLLVFGGPSCGGPGVLQKDAHAVALVGGVQRGEQVSVLLGPPARRGESFFSGDVVVGPDHAEVLQLRDAVFVHVSAGVEAPGVGDPLPQREGGEGDRPSVGFRFLVAAVGDAVGEGDFQVAVEPVLEGGGFDAASPVLVFGVEDAQVDEDGQLGGVAGGAECQQLSGRY